MKLQYVALCESRDPLAAKVLSVLGSEKHKLQVLSLAATASEMPSASVAVITRPTQSWYMYVYDMTKPEHRTLFAGNPLVRKSAFVIGVRESKSSERRFWKSVNRIPEIVERILKYRPAA